MRFELAQRDGVPTKLVGTSSAGPGPNAVRPYVAAQKTRIFSVATQGDSPALRYILEGNAKRQ
jgi:hypothetical protein